MGIEGVWGLLLCAAVAMPISAALPGKNGDGIHEDTLDRYIHTAYPTASSSNLSVLACSFELLHNSSSLQALFACYCLVILGFNAFGMRINQVKYV